MLDNPLSEAAIVTTEEAPTPNNLLTAAAYPCWMRYRNFLFAGGSLVLAAAIYAQSGRSAPSLGNGTFDELAHAIAHFGLFFLLASMLAGVLNARDYSPRMWAAIGLAVAYGITDELHQSFVSAREASFIDVLLDLGGAVAGGHVYVAAASFLRRKRSSLI